MGWILGDKFDTVYPHKGSIKALWERKWRAADGKLEDFEPIFENCCNINDAHTEAYTATFPPFAESLEQQAAAASRKGDDTAESGLLLRAADSPIVLWGLSAAGFYAIRAAHTHRSDLAGCIAHGPGAHLFLSKMWLSRVEDHEYPFPIIRAWAERYGYDDSADFCKNPQTKFSLLETGVLDRRCTRLLLLNGIVDGVVPIEDCLLLFNHGSPKDGRFYPGLPHMGYPLSLEVAYKCLEGLL
ncbi:hypothetical protein BDW66DRAFT_151525 [Aspergillus desertorum]